MPSELLPELFDEKISIPGEDKKVRDPTILGEQARVGWKFANYFNTNFVWPETYYDDLPYGVKGVETSIGDKKYIIYYESIFYNPADKKRVPRHEIGHVYQLGTDVLSTMYSVYVFFDGESYIRLIMPTGRILVEGGVERLLEKIGEEKTGAYKGWANVATEIDYVTPIENFYSTAENKGKNAVWNELNYSGAIEVIDNYVSNLLKKIDPEFNPVWAYKMNFLAD